MHENATQLRGITKLQVTYASEEQLMFMKGNCKTCARIEGVERRDEEFKTAVHYNSIEIQHLSASDTRDVCTIFYCSVKS